ncbi:hypothetical protein [Planococcus faecalis]|nr:hypothetical protein [Planococcus faecalis]
METPEKITVVTDSGEVVASISFKEGNAIIADGYRVLGYDKD